MTGEHKMTIDQSSPQPVKLIIDSDPGVDDVMAFLLALNQPHVDLKLISLVFGNCSTEDSLRNTVSTFHVLKLEEEYRNRVGKKACGWKRQKPKVAVGLTTALDGSKLDATEFHGADGLGNVHTNAPEYTASADQLEWFTRELKDEALEAGFIPSSRPSYLEMLDILREEPANTVTIAAIGPLQNIAKAAELEPETFAKVKEVVVMGGTFEEPGNVSPYSEFNVFCDAEASARVYALTGAKPEVTLPKGSPDCLKSFPKPLSLTLFPLDITHKHELNRSHIEQCLKPLIQDGSPLATWIYTWLTPLLDHKGVINVHDALTVWYACTSDLPGWKIERGHDVRVETTGEWTRGTTVIDRRGKPKFDKPSHNDRGTWLMTTVGNRVDYAVESPAPGDSFGQKLFELVL